MRYKKIITGILIIGISFSSAMPAAAEENAAEYSTEETLEKDEVHEGTTTEQPAPEIEKANDLESQKEEGSTTSQQAVTEDNMAEGRTPEWEETTVDTEEVNNP